PHLVTHRLLDQRAELGARSMDAALYRSVGQTCDRGDLLVGKIFHVAEDQHLSEIRLDLGDGALDHELELHPLDELIRPADVGYADALRRRERDALSHGIDIVLVAGMAPREVFCPIFAE